MTEVRTLLRYSVTAVLTICLTTTGIADELQNRAAVIQARAEQRVLARVESYRSKPSSTGRLQLVGATDKVLQALRGVENIQTLSCIALCRYSDVGIRQLSALPNVRSIILGSSEQFTGEGLQHLDPMPSVESLTMFKGVTDLRGLRNFPNLRKLNVSLCEFSEADLTSLAGSPKLEELKLGKCPDLTHRGAAHIAQLENLRRLHLQSSSIGDEGVRHLSQLTKLEHLSFRSSHLTGAGFASLSQLAHLKSLSVGFSGEEFFGDPGRCLQGLNELTMLTIPSVPLTSEQLDAISRLPKLETLSLRDSGLPEDPLLALAGMKSLKQLSVWQARLEPAELQQFDAATQARFTRTEDPTLVMDPDTWTFLRRTSFINIDGRPDDVVCVYERKHRAF